jgi:peptide deformylase
MLKLIDETDPILKLKATPWVFGVDLNAPELEKNMVETMILHNGVGLAANQVGLLKRVFAITLSNGRQLCMFNPTVTSTSEELQQGSEGCLSFPDLWLDVERPKTIVSEYFDNAGNSCILVLEGLDARCFLHELDHLNGICFVDKVSKLKLAMANKKRLKRKKNGRT